MRRLAPSSALPRLRLAAGLAGLAMLAGCAPALVPVEQAERSCLTDIHAARPDTRVSMGVVAGPHGVRPHAGLSVSMSGTTMMGRDPSDEFNRCVMRRSGQMPTRPLAQQPAVAGQIR